MSEFQCTRSNTRRSFIMLVKNTNRGKHGIVHQFARISPTLIKYISDLLDRPKRSINAWPELRVLLVMVPLRLAAAFSWEVFLDRSRTSLSGRPFELSKKYFFQMILAPLETKQTHCKIALDVSDLSPISRWSPLVSDLSRSHHAAWGNNLDRHIMFSLVHDPRSCNACRAHATQSSSDCR